MISGDPAPISVIPLEEALRRSRRMLRSALGSEVCGWLDDDGVAEVHIGRPRISAEPPGGGGQSRFKKTIVV